ncbi:SGNH/GDSL hydrolase family protein [Bacillus timonensis]|uniref:SGNH/GDSL hydrolase family protein n=1 Tax=Bacillus timonensis TaxID=1033734 RepID=UPI000289DADC|nr:SGNH/GDSL hydrolase family protein [Bacillus timonensis]
MKKLIVIFVSVLSLAVIIAGKVHWDSKIEATTKAESQLKNSKAEGISGKDASDKKKGETPKEDLIAYTKNLPEEVVSKIELAIQSKEPLKLVIMGSASTPEDPNGWPTLFKQELENTYGKDVFEVSIHEYPNLTSETVVTEELYQEVIDLKPDVLLLEPFILADNGLVTMDDRLENLTTMLTDFYNQLPELTVLLQPANPLLKATYYPNEVQELKGFAEQNGYIYLDHWTAWPDHQTDDIEDYLVDGLPSEKGHKVWADYLINYFVAK